VEKVSDAIKRRSVPSFKGRKGAVKGKNRNIGSTHQGKRREENSSAPMGKEKFTGRKGGTPEKGPGGGCRQHRTSAKGGFDGLLDGGGRDRHVWVGKRENYEVKQSKGSFALRDAAQKKKAKQP